MELNGALSNPRLRVELPRLAALQSRLRGLAFASPKTPRPPRARIGVIIDAITNVLEHTDRPMRASDIHVAAEALVGQPIKRTTVKATLAAHASGPRPRFQRVSYGRYHIA